MDGNQQAPQNSPKGYGKRPLWFWILIYVIVGLIVYGLIYWFVTQGGGGGNGGGGDGGLY